MSPMGKTNTHTPGRQRHKGEEAMPQKTMRLSYFSVMAYLLTGRRAYRGDADSPARFLKLTTTGRKSGKPRTVDRLHIRDGAAYALTPSNGGGRRPPGRPLLVLISPHAALCVP